MLKKSLFIRILIIAALLLANLRWEIVSASPVDSEIQSTILFVKPGADGDCLSWDTACELQTALFNAIEGNQIWVAAGTYKPTTDDNRESTFQLKNGVAIYGGFPDNGGDFSQRDWETYPTTLSGDIGVTSDNADNSYHVVTGSEVDVTTILDGFTISLGNAFGTYPYDCGGGMFNNRSSPSLTNVTFSSNSASYGGGGMSNWHSSSPSLTNVTFSSNSASYGGGGMYNQDSSNPSLTNVIFSDNSVDLGGGMYNEFSSPTLTDVTFSGNTSSYGGGMYNTYGSNPHLTNVTFNSNSASSEGGGMYNYSSSPNLTNVTFSSNSATSYDGDSSYGGGLFDNSSNPILSNVTFSGNSASYGGGMYNYSNSSPNLTNVTFSDNTATDYGGGMFNNSSNPILRNVTFNDNAVNGDISYGGGMFNNSSNPILSNVTFSGNSASYGGGMYNYSNSSPSLTNVTFSGNTATSDGGGIYNIEGSPSLTNAILWGNTPSQISGSSATVTYSDIQGDDVYPGDGNINENPLLGNLADNGGFTLTHELGVGSPAIDKGNPELCPLIDQRSYARPVDGDEDGLAVCDMGAYEYASSPATFPLVVDVVGNGSVIKYQDKLEYLYGEEVTLTAIADQNWEFVDWGGDASGSNNPLTFTLEGNTNITAYFSKAQNVVYYVKPGADGDCLSWETACELQTALFTATEGDQIWVAAGTYKPTTDDNREATFQLINGVAIYGGFPANGGDFSQRDWETYATTLSGDIGNEDDNSDNSYQVVTGSGVVESAVLDGFTVSGGNANGGWNTAVENGGGMYNSSGSPTLTNLTFSDNSASENGGGMYNVENSNPMLSNVTFSGNRAQAGGGMSNNNSSPSLTNVTFSGNSANPGVDGAGGGMYNSQSQPTLSNVTFTGNTAAIGGGMSNMESSPTMTDVTFSYNTVASEWGSSGGGMDNLESSPVLTNVSFIGNSADNGGGMDNSYSSPSLTNVTFTSNTASYDGGGMYNWYSSPSLTNVTFTSNTATNNGGGMYNHESSPTLTNAILWGNTPSQVYGSATVTYSDIQGDDVYPGDGNINENPLLGNLADNGGFTQTHELGENSPAIDTGNPVTCPVTDQRGYPRPIDGDIDGTAVCDMGAYEYGSTIDGFTLTVNVSGNGSVDKVPLETGYFFGDIVILTATPTAGWKFTGWSGDVTSIDNPLALTITGNTNVTVNFTDMFYIYLPLILKN